MPPGASCASSDPLLGSWSATRWQYASRARPDRLVDVVCDLGGSVTVSLSDGAYVLTWTLAGRASGSVGGTLSVCGDHLSLLAQGAAEAESVRYHLAAETLSLSSEQSSWEFDGRGDEPADFVAVLVRVWSPWSRASCGPRAEGV